MKKAVFTIQEYDGVHNAGPKAKLDIDFFLKEEGFKIVHRKYNVHSKIAKLFDYYFSIPRIFNKDEVYDELFFQYPTYSSFLMKKLIREFQNHSSKLYFIIHDVESLRLFYGNEEYWRSEKALFNKTDGLIVHNKHMKKWLMDNGVHVPMVCLDVFDYKTEFKPKISGNPYNSSVCFAGNLKKSQFLNNLTLKYSTLDIYGQEPSHHYGCGLFYKGQYSPDVLPNYLNQDFGLVWDGNSTETCNGKFGKYMRFNNPHKVSLYLSSGLPVIIWDKAALSDFIVENKLGFSVGSLSEMDLILKSITTNQYSEYKKNVINLSKKLTSGFFIKNSIERLEQLDSNER